MKTIKKNSIQELKLLKILIPGMNLFFLTFIIRRNIILLQRNSMQIYESYISFGGVMSGTKWGKKGGEKRQRSKAANEQLDHVH